MDEASLAGTMYRSLARSRRRRQAELVALLKSLGSAAAAAESYRDDHPLEPAISGTEMNAAAAEVEASRSRTARSAKKPEKARPIQPDPHT